MTRVVKCPKCGKLGSLQPKKIKHTIYWRVGHYIGLKGKTRKVKWCYIGKELPESITKQLITQKEQLITQEFTQSDVKKNNLKLSPNLKKLGIQVGYCCWGRGPVWSKIRAWGVRGPGFKSPRPHQMNGC